jgi:hypothetical protein
MIATPAEPEKAADNSGNAASAQRARLLAALRHLSSITTLEARRTLDVLHPAARIQELREAGHNIATIWTRDVTSEGHSHRVAKYVLKPKRCTNNEARQGSLDLETPC